MKHYEIVMLVHPDQSEQVPSMIERHKTLIKDKGGVVQRFEDWGRRQLAYPIKKAYKAHYILMNIECDDETLKEITNSFRFNDAILRNLVLRRKCAITSPSCMMSQKENKRSNVSNKTSEPKANDDKAEDLANKEDDKN